MQANELRNSSISIATIAAARRSEESRAGHHEGMERRGTHGVDGTKSNEQSRWRDISLRQSLLHPHKGRPLSLSAVPLLRPETAQVGERWKEGGWRREAVQRGFFQPRREAALQIKNPETTKAVQMGNLRRRKTETGNGQRLKRLCDGTPCVPSSPIQSWYVFRCGRAHRFIQHCKPGFRRDHCVQAEAADG